MRHLAPAVVAFGLLVAACGDDSGSNATPAATTVSAATTAPATTTAPTTAAPATSAAPATTAASGAVSVATANNAKVGTTILVDGQGRTLYLFEKDQGTTSACVNACAKAWPAFMGTATAGAGANASLLGAANGQVTYNGHLLYYFAADKAAGDANGIGIPSWYTVAPDGNKVDKS
jgi:predicted lipoprotein with Yx(FWY)xxD motif